MNTLTRIASMVLTPKARQALAAATDAERTQRKQLQWLLSHAERTQWGRAHGITSSMTYEQYAATVPVEGYEHFRPYVMRMVQGERDVLWPGVTRRFAQSSGTTGGRSKFIPVTQASLRVNHYAGASLSVGSYLQAYPGSRVFDGKAFILGGSFATELSTPKGVKVGDLSANLIEAMNPLVELRRVPSRQVALMQNWHDKLPALVEASVKEDITNISGVPSWFLTVLKGVLERTGASTVQEVWPHLEVFFHGGISFAPYVDEYAKIMAPGMRYWETYNASEGFFAAKCGANDTSMLLHANTGVFYEFAPIEEADSEHPHAVPLWQVEPGKTYALIISAPNGLWRYMLGDTVTVEQTAPVKITIAGRTKNYINAFGEEVMVHNTDNAIAHTCHALGCSIANYTAAPVYTEGKHRGRHQWLIEWQTPPDDIEAFAEALDLALQQENSDYQAKRQDGIFLDRLEIVSAPQGIFDKWLETTGKLGGQRKVPRLSNDRHLMDQLLGMLHH